jgi:hypothetical protein
VPFSRRRFLLGSAALLLTGCAERPTIASVETSGEVARPGAPGVAEPVRVAYTLRRPASVSAVLQGAGQEWRLREPTHRQAGEQYQISFDGTVPLGPGADRAVLPDGSYELRLRAEEGDGPRDERAVPLRVVAADTVPLELTGPTLSLSTITPDGDGVDDEVRIAYRLGKEATVEIWAFDDRGVRATILAPNRRPAGDHSLLWDGSAGGRVFGGKRLFDGQYTVALRARDEAGNVRQREAPLRIANGGVERVEIAEVEITPAALRLGEKLHLRVRAVNTGETTVRTMGPPPGTEYRTGQSFSALIDPGTERPYQPLSGAWRVGLGWATEDQELPLRWGLLPDPGATLAPGDAAVIEADVVVDDNVLLALPEGAPVRFFVGAAREGVGLRGGRVGDHLVHVTR